MFKIIFYLLIILFLPGSWATAQKSCVTADCHQAFQEEESTHPGGAACRQCHQGDAAAHVEEEASLDLAEKICGNCHQELLRHEYSHPPAGEGGCSLCHYPHGDITRKLLPENYPVGFYEDYREDSYELCFSCHKRIIVRFPDTTYATGFRNGKRNLHYTHVNKSHRGRTCKLCHRLHSGKNPELIAGTIQFGEWDMEINFEKTEDGGSCAPGCHRPQSYSRAADEDK